MINNSIMSKKGIQIVNIIPQSISAISNNLDNSLPSLQGASQQKKSKENTAQYKIKLKKPLDQSSKNLNSSNNKSIQKSQSNQFQISEDYERQPHIEAQIVPLGQTITGYEICKTSFSEEQIIQAFKVIDINKDQIITEDDIIFFLDYIKQPYTKEEVREMIEMISSNKKKVTFHDFKKIGKGSIIPFADIRIPDEVTKQKKLIYQNIKHNSFLSKQNPSILINASKNQILTLKKFQQSKKAPKNSDFQQVKIVDEQEQLQFLAQKINLIPQEQFNIRKEQFRNVDMVNVTQVIKNYHQFLENSSANNDYKYISNKEVAKILQISQKSSKLLYTDSKNILAKKVLLQAIAFSPLNKIKQLQLGMIIFLKKKTINFQQLYFLLQVLRGADKSDGLRRKLLTVFKSKNIGTQTEINKFYALELIKTYNFNLNL